MVKCFKDSIQDIRHLLKHSYVIWWKEMRVWLKTPLIGLSRAFILPFTWMVIFGNAFGGNISYIPVAMVNEDLGQHGNDFINMLESTNTLSITTNTNYANALELFKAKKVNAVIFINQDFSKKIDEGKQANIQVTVDQTSTMVATSISSFVNTIVSAFSKKITLTYLNKIDPANANTILNPVEVTSNVLFGRGMSYLDFMAAGVIIQTLVFSALFSGGMTLMMDREFGTLKMLMMAPINKTSIILGKTLAGVTQALISGFIALGIAVLLGIKIKTGILGILCIILIMILTAFGFIGMSTAIAMRFTKMETLMVAMMTLTMPLWFLSGALYPLESMPWWLKPLSTINPLTYAVDAMRSVMYRGVIWAAFALDMLVLLFFSVLMILLGTTFFKRTIE